VTCCHDSHSQESATHSRPFVPTTPPPSHPPRATPSHPPRATPSHPPRATPCSRTLRLGNSALRDLLLQAQGLRVLPLPYFVWEALERLPLAAQAPERPSGRAASATTRDGRGTAPVLRELERMLLHAAATGDVLWQHPPTAARYGLTLQQATSGSRQATHHVAVSLDSSKETASKQQQQQ
jgi:hypothetical protein